jgi:hypothetical protein
VGTEEVNMNVREEIGTQIDAEIVDEFIEEDWQNKDYEWAEAVTHYI